MAYVVSNVLGGVIQKIFLIFVCVSIFACGMVIMVTNGRLIFSMARDRRLPGHQFLRQVPRATGGPSWATVLAAVLGGIIVIALRAKTSALATLFTASTIMPALLYAGTVLLYVFTRRGSRTRPFGKYEWPIIAGAVIWLAYELIILIGPGMFRDAQHYVLGALGVGLIFYILQLFVPALAGLGAPHWSPNARGILTGLQLSTERGHIARAVAEGIAASVAILARAAAADLGAPLTALRVDGGLTRSRLLLQAQADLLQVPVLVCRNPHATALGAAALARLGMGESEPMVNAEVEVTVEPSISEDQSSERAAAYSSALQACLA